ncbi:hypothetical protein [Mesorhizobium loti]|nr:hypothetical protein [Mesorhizobium loti]
MFVAPQFLGSADGASRHGLLHLDQRGHWAPKLRMAMPFLGA